MQDIISLLKEKGCKGEHGGRLTVKEIKAVL